MFSSRAAKVIGMEGGLVNLASRPASNLPVQGGETCGISIGWLVLSCHFYKAQQSRVAWRGQKDFALT